MAGNRSLPSTSQKNAARKARKNRLLARKEDFISPLLARRSCHLPGNNWWADWRQWFCNNHILFGICLHHPLHPVEWWERVLAIVASISFGLCATNAVYEVYRQDAEKMNSVLFTMMGFSITKGMAWLWTLGCLCHSVFDFIIWKVMACACCHPGGAFGNCFCHSSFQNCGSYLLIPLIMMLLSLATFMVLRRASQDPAEEVYYQQEQYYGDDNAEMDGADGGGADDDFYVDWEQIDGPGSFRFLAKYSVELLLAWFFYFPVIGTIMFSGVLGCGRLPVLGGRPRDKRLVEEESREYQRW